MKSILYLAAFFLLSAFSAMAQQAGVLKPGDSVTIEMQALPGEAPMPAVTYVVSDEGNLKLPLLQQEIPAAGIALKSLTSRVNEAFKTSGIDPVPSVKAIYLTPPDIISHSGEVGGEVRISGEFALRKGMHLMSAINRAGGFTESAATSRVKLIRANKETFHDLRVIKADGSNNPVLMDGDVIVVPAFSAVTELAGLLKPGDAIVLRVKSADKDGLEIATAYSISDRGMIRMPMLEKEIPATGISPAALKSKINEAYKEAHISAVVQLVEQESTNCNHVVTVSGGVRHPGEYPLRQGMTLMAAITRAGGTGFREPRKLKLIRDKKETIYDVRKMNPDGSNNPILMDGDVIIVPEP